LYAFLFPFLHQSVDSSAEGLDITVQVKEFATLSIGLYIFNTGNTTQQALLLFSFFFRENRIARCAARR
jgi:hypothetical protein